MSLHAHKSVTYLKSVLLIHSHKGFLSCQQLVWCHFGENCNKHDSLADPLPTSLMVRAAYWLVTPSLLHLLKFTLR